MRFLAARGESRLEWRDFRHGLIGHWLLLLPLLAGSLQAGTPPHASEFDSLLTEGKRLLREERFLSAEEVLHKALEHDPANPEAIFLLGLALAKQEKWEASRQQLERATTQQPDFLPAHLELAGVQFKMGSRKQPIHTLRKVLSLDPHHEYAHRFLATLLYLEEQRIEALHHWNQAGGPRVGQITYRVPPETGAELLQHLFPLNEGEILRARQILDIRWKQKRFHLGPPFHWYLQPDRKTLWDLEIVLARPLTLPFPQGFLLENAARALFYQEVAAGYPTATRSGKQLYETFRWDPHRKRARTVAEVPFLSSSSDALHLGFDFREETWRHTPSANEFLFQTEEVFVDYEYLMRNRRSFSLRAGYGHRFFRQQNFPHSPHLLQLGFKWDQLVGLNRADTAQLHWTTRFDTLSGITGEKSQAQQISSAARLNLPLDDPSRARLGISLRAGLSSRDLPIVDYFVLGVGQDQPLPLRAHPTVERGHKGHGPMGRNYLLANFELHRRLLRWRFTEIGGLAFSDTAFVSGRPFESAAPLWFQDIGCGLRLRALGHNLAQVLFGLDLRTSSFNYWIGLPLSP